MSNTIYINGKFVAQDLTGVQRYAKELIKAIDRLLASARFFANFKLVLLVPYGYKNSFVDLKYIEVREQSTVYSLHLWEQIVLLFGSKSSLLVNLAGSAPLFKFNQICTFHDAAIYDVPASYKTIFILWYRLLFWIQSRFCRRILTVSNFSRSRLANKLSVNLSSIGVVYNGSSHMKTLSVDESVFDLFNLTRGNYLLAVGSENPSKNFNFLVEAFTKLDCHLNAKLVVVGGINNAVFSGYKNEFIIDTRITYTGRLDDEKLKALYLHARAFVFPSVYEGFGIPPVEAMVCGCPVLASFAASIPEVCADAVAYFDPYDIKNLTTLIKRALEDSVWLDGLRIKGFERSKELTWDHAACQLLAEISSLGFEASPSGVRKN